LFSAQGMQDARAELPGDASARPAFRFGQIEDYPLVEQGDPDEGGVFNVLFGY